MIYQLIYTDALGDRQVRYVLEDELRLLRKEHAGRLISLQELYLPSTFQAPGESTRQLLKILAKWGEK